MRRAAELGVVPALEARLVQAEAAHAECRARGGGQQTAAGSASSRLASDPLDPLRQGPPWLAASVQKLRARPRCAPFTLSRPSLAPSLTLSSSSPSLNPTELHSPPPASTQRPAAALGESLQTLSPRARVQAADLAPSSCSRSSARRARPSSRARARALRPRSARTSSRRSLNSATRTLSSTRCVRLLSPSSSPTQLRVTTSAPCRVAQPRADCFALSLAGRLRRGERVGRRPIESVAGGPRPPKPRAQALEPAEHNMDRPPQRRAARDAVERLVGTRSPDPPRVRPCSLALFPPTPQPVRS